VIEHLSFALESILYLGEKGNSVMIDHDNLEDFRDPQIYDLQDEGYYDD